MSRRLNYLIFKAPHYDLYAEYLNENTIKIYSPKYNFDSWLVEENLETRKLIVHHLSKNLPHKKCCYHVHLIVSFRDKIKILKKIKDHNQYVAFYKKRNKINLVDRVLGGLK